MGLQKAFSPVALHLFVCLFHSMGFGWPLSCPCIMTKGVRHRPRETVPTRFYYPYLSLYTQKCHFLSR